MKHLLTPDLTPELVPIRPTGYPIESLNDIKEFADNIHYGKIEEPPVGWRPTL
jgi:hypothetical protein